mgnify:CR=1 FL=1
MSHETVIIRHHLLKRNFLLYVPSSYDGTESVPLVLVFHGGPNTPENSSIRFGVSEKAEEKGFIVVYPNGKLEGYGILDKFIYKGKGAPKNAPIGIAYFYKDTEVIVKINQ